MRTGIPSIWLGLGAVVALGLVFANTLTNSFHYDDIHSIVTNPYIRSLDYIFDFFVDPKLFSALEGRGMYRPVLLVSYAINHRLGGDQVLGYHLVNVALHLSCVAWVWLIGIQGGLSRDGAGLAALLWGLHPLVSEPVNYISSRSEGLAACFYLVAFWGYQRGGRVAYVLALLCFAAGLLTKSVVISLPIVLGVSILGWPKASRQWSKLLPFLAMAVGYVALLTKLGFLQSSASRAPRGLVSQLWTQLKAALYYAKLWIVPRGLNVEHQFFEAPTLWQPAVLLSGAVVLGLAWLVYKGWSRPGVPWLVWVPITLAPASLVPLNVLVNEHRLYLPMVGLCLWLVTMLERGWTWNRVRWGWALGGIFVLALGTYQRNQIWRDEMTLWSDAVQKAPAMFRAQMHLGGAYEAAGNWEKALVHHSKAVELAPSGEGIVYYNLANVLRQLEDYDGAIKAYERCLERTPSFEAAANNLALLHYNQANNFYEHKDWLRAVDQYRQALAIRPQWEKPRYNLGDLYIQQGNFKAAEALFRQGLRWAKPGSKLYYGLARAQEGLGAIEKAIINYERFLQVGDLPAAQKAPIRQRVERLRVHFNNTVPRQKDQ